MEGQMCFAFKDAMRAPCHPSDVSSGIFFPCFIPIPPFVRLIHCSQEPTFGTRRDSPVFQGQAKSVSLWKRSQAQGASQQGQLPHAACGLALIGVGKLQDREKVEQRWEMLEISQSERNKPSTSPPAAWKSITRNRLCGGQTPLIRQGSSGLHCNEND
jgi:hypothetical protein